MKYLIQILKKIIDEKTVSDGFSVGVFGGECSEIYCGSCSKEIRMEKIQKITTDCDLLEKIKSVTKQMTGAKLVKEICRIIATSDTNRLHSLSES
uniref:Uncharacterized protein n=1 Tax=Marseillevirus LCMAC102 TaxID=2506603 RepID=A0A481YUJ6_9VIRU|nr:MAG: hypothetical protein LCMAC102_04020 [Marseillevirus LCMAC102]